MNIYCRTNLDCMKHQNWPKLYQIPQIGSLIQAESGWELKVVSVTY